MSRPLIVLAGRIDIAHQYLYNDPKDYYKDYPHIIFALNEDRIRGISNPDILFLYGWWSRRQSYEIIKGIEAIMIS
jgi:hypothetical protein